MSQDTIPGSEDSTDGTVDDTGCDTVTGCKDDGGTKRVVGQENRTPSETSQDIELLSELQIRKISTVI